MDWYGRRGVSGWLTFAEVGFDAIDEGLFRSRKNEVDLHEIFNTKVSNVVYTHTSFFTAHFTSRLNWEADTSETFEILEEPELVPPFPGQT